MASTTTPTGSGSDPAPRPKRRTFSAASTSCGWSRRTTRPRPARRARSCAASGCTTRTSSNGARPARPGLVALVDRRTSAVRPRKAAEQERLRKKVARLERDLARRDAALEVMGKANAVDAVVARLPFATDQLHVTILYDEPRLLLAPVGHRLAGKGSVTLDDIADEPTPCLPDPVWNAFWRIDPRPDGSRAPEGPQVETLEDKLELVASGQAVAISPAGSLATNNRPDLTTTPLLGIEPAHVVLATRGDDRRRLIAAFRTTAQAHLTSPDPDAQASPVSALAGTDTCSRVLRA